MLVVHIGYIKHSQPFTRGWVGQMLSCYLQSHLSFSLPFPLVQRKQHMLCGNPVWILNLPFPNRGSTISCQLVKSPATFSRTEMGEEILCFQAKEDTKACNMRTATHMVNYSYFVSEMEITFQMCGLLGKPCLDASPL